MHGFTVIEWSGGVRVSKRHTSYIPQGYVMIQVHYAVWSGIEESVRYGVILPRHGVIMGSSGLGRVIETGPGVDPSLSGRYVVPTTVERQYCMGVDTDGFLGEYTVVQSRSLTVLDTTPEQLDALALHASIAYDAVSRIESHDYPRILVIGAGITGLLASLELIDRGYIVDTYTLKYEKSLCSLRFVKRMNPAEYNAIILMSPLPLSWYTSILNDNTLLLVHPLVAPITTPQSSSRIEVLRGVPGLYWRGIIRKHVDCLRDYIWNIVEGLVEPPPLNEILSHVYMVRKD